MARIPGGSVKPPAFARWDARVALGPWLVPSIHAQAQNLLDARIEAESEYPEPGIRVWVGLQAAVRQLGAGAS